MAAAAVLLPWLAWLAISFLALSLLNLITAHARRHRHPHRNLPLPPGPRPLPLIGSIHLLGTHPHRSLAHLANLHGPLISLRLGSSAAATAVVASSPAAAREVLHRHDGVFGAARSVPHAIAGDLHAAHSVAWLPAAHPRWRALRKLMGAELFAPRRLDALQGLRRDKVRELVGHVAAMAREGREVDVGRAAFVTSLNLLARTIFSRDLTGLDDGGGGSKEFQSLVTGIMEAAGSPNVSDFFPAIAGADLQGWRRRAARLFEKLHRVFDAEIDQRMVEREAAAGAGGESETRKNDFLDLLLDTAAAAERDGDDTAFLDRDTLRSMFTDLFVAGSDTSSSTVEWAMAELLQNPSCMSKVREELSTVLDSRENVEESEIIQLPYLQAVVKETFRLHPSIPLLLPRRNEVETEIMGYTIPQGSRVFVNVWAMGRDEKTWPEPERFLPERFLGTSSSSAAAAADLRGAGGFALIPFGAGRRICPGMPLAIRMVHLLLASLLHQFRWRLPDDVERNGIDMTEKFGVALAKAVPLCAIPTPV